MAPQRSRSFSRWVLLLGVPLLGASCTGLLDLNPQPEPPGFGSTTTGTGANGMTGTAPTGTTPAFNETGSAGTGATTTGSTTTNPDGTILPPTGAGGAPSGGVATGAPGAAGASPIGAGQAGTGAMVGAGGATTSTTGGAGGSANAAGGSSAGGAAGSGGAGGADVGGAAGEDSGGSGGMGGASAMVSVAACQEYESQDIACLAPAVIIDSVIYSSGEVRGGYFADAECNEPLGAIEKSQQAPWVMRGTLQDTALECLFEVGAPYVGQLFTNSESDECAAVTESPAIYEGLNLYHIGAAFQGELCE